MGVAGRRAGHRAQLRGNARPKQRKTATGEPATPFMRFGDRVRIEVLDAAGANVFAAIEQVVERG